MFQFSIFNYECQRQFLCTHDAYDYNVKNCVLLLNDYYSLSQEICDEREMCTIKR